MTFNISIPLSLEWLAGIAIDNLANMLAAVEGTKPRYSISLEKGIGLITIELPEKVYNHLLSLAQSQTMQSLFTRFYHLVDGFLARILHTARIQDVVLKSIEDREKFEESINTVDVAIEERKIVIKWGSQGRWITHNLIPFPLRSVEFLEGARTTCPVQLAIERKKRGKIVKEGMTIELNIDTYVYSLISLSLIASTILLDRWPPRNPRDVRALLYRLSGYDASKILSELARSARVGWKLFRDLLGSEQELNKLFKLDRERGLQTPEVLTMHYLIAALSRYAELYDARLDIVSYKHTAGKRGDIELYLSIHFGEYRILTHIFAKRPGLAEQYMKVLSEIAAKYFSDNEEERRAATLGIELVNLVDKIGRGIASLFDIYTLMRILATYFGSKHYAVFGDSFKVFEDIAHECLNILG